MKKLFKILVPIFFLFFSSSVVGDEVVIPSINKLFKENRLVIGGPQKPFHGCIIDILYPFEDPLTGKSKIHTVLVGDKNQYVDIFVEDFYDLIKGDKNSPIIGDCFAFESVEGIFYDSYNGWMGGAKLYEGNDYIVDNEIITNIILKDKITVEEYFQDNNNYGSKIIELTGKVNKIIHGNQNVRFELISEKVMMKHKVDYNYVIDAEYDADIWKDDDLIKNKILSIKEDDIITFKGHLEKNDFTIFTHPFTVYEIINL